MALYFAYDRRISQDLLEEEIHADPGSIERVGPAHLPGWRFVCNRSVSRASGVVLQCNAVASQGGNEGTAVEGMVFRLTDTQLGALDQVQQKGLVGGTCEQVTVSVTPHPSPETTSPAPVTAVLHSFRPFTTTGPPSGGEQGGLDLAMQGAKVDYADLGQTVYAAGQAKLSASYVAQLEALAQEGEGGATEEEGPGEAGARVFVYGTLLQGLHNHHLLEGSRKVGAGWSKERMVMRHKGVPFVSRQEEVCRIRGEVYEVNGPTLQRLDKLEGHPTWYRREEIEVELEGGAGVRAYVYMLGDMGEGASVIGDGDYRAFVQHRRAQQEQPAGYSVGRRQGH